MMTNYDAIEQLTKLKGVCEQMGWSNNVKALEMAISTLKTPQLWTSPLLPRGAYNRKRGTDDGNGEAVAWMEIPPYKEKQ